MEEKEKLFRYIEQADIEECLCIAAILLTSEKMKGVKYPTIPATRGAYKRAIKRLRLTQACHPEEREALEDAIQFIRREYLHREV